MTVGSLVVPRFEHTAFGQVSGVGFGFAGLCWIGAVTGPVGLLLGGIAGDFLGSRTVIAGTAIGFVGAAGYWYVVPVLRTFPPVTEISAGEFTIEQRN